MQVKPTRWVKNNPLGFVRESTTRWVLCGRVQPVGFCAGEYNPLGFVYEL